MKQYDIEQMAVAAEKRVMRFGRWMWFLVLPVLAVVLFFVFSAHQPPPRHYNAPVFNCASENASISALDAGGQIAPLCGDTPYPSGG